MRKIVLIVALCAAFVAWGENRKLLTMEDAILKRDLIPQNYDIRFSKENPFLAAECSDRGRRFSAANMTAAYTALYKELYTISD